MPRPSRRSLPVSDADSDAVARLLALVENHVSDDAAEAHTLDRFRAFAARHPDLMRRTCAPGHVTASAVVTDPAGERVLLLHHRRLSRWLQPGGHIEGEGDPLIAARREVTEETGLATLSPARRDVGDASGPLDFDVHLIPWRRGEPGHLHLDVRYHLVADRPKEATVGRAEARALRWFGWDEALSLPHDPATVRMLHKARRAVGGRGR